MKKQECVDTSMDLTSWQDARTLNDLGRCMAQWLEGLLPYSPGYYGKRPESETDSLIPFLTTYNRAEFITTCSQPGIERDVYGYAQRAFVAGFTTEIHKNRLCTLELSTDLVVFATPCCESISSSFIPVTIEDFEPYTWAGVIGEDAIVPFLDACTPELKSVLISVWDVVIIDPVWGRNTVLWSQIQDALSGV